jgi:hypothetical protein
MIRVTIFQNKMNIKKALSIAIAIFLFGTVLSPAYAQDQSRQNVVRTAMVHANSGVTNTMDKKMVRVQEKMDAMENKQASRAGDLKTRADNEIARRITSLQKLINKINLLKKLNADQKASLSTKVQDEIASLNNLKEKIDGDTDQATLKADVKSIVQSYKVYLFFMPQVNELAALNKIITISDDYSVLLDQLTTKLHDMKEKGTDTTSDEALLADAKAKAADAKTQANKAITMLESLTPESYPGSKTILMEVRTTIKAAMTDLEIARMDVRKIITSMGGAAKPSGAMPSEAMSPMPTSAAASPTP